MNIINNETFELKAIRENFNLFMNFIESCSDRTGINKQDKSNILLASEEIIVNIMDYAYPHDQGSISINFSHINNIIKITYSDSGRPFNPLEVQETITDLPLEKRGLGGYGILIVKKIMDSVLYEYVNENNRLTIIKNIRQ